jgi:hypothetical protein
MLEPPGQSPMAGRAELSEVSEGDGDDPYAGVVSVQEMFGSGVGYCGDNVS